MADKKATLWLHIKTAGEEALDKLSSGLEKLKEVGLVAFAALSAVVIKSIADYRQQEEATNALTRAMINNGIYTKQLKDEYLANASALQKLTTFGDEQIIAAQATIQGYVGQTKVTRELTMATLNLAAAKKMDLASAAEIVGKSIGTATNALARHGVEVSENASRQEKLSQIITGINKHFGGQAEAAAQGLGQIEQLKNTISDLAEELGERLAPAVTLITGWFKSAITDSEAVKVAMNGIVFVVQFLAKAGLEAAFIFDQLGISIGGNLAGAVEAAKAAISGNFSQALTIIKDGGKAIDDELLKNEQSYIEKMKALDAAFLAGKQENLAAEEQMEKESRGRSREAKEIAAAESNLNALNNMIAQQEIEMQQLQASEEQKTMAALQARKKRDELLLKQTTDARKKEALTQDIYNTNEQIKEQIKNEMIKKNREDTLNKLAGLQSSNNSFLAAAGKAAALTQIAIETPVAVAKALSAFPPPFNFAAAAAVGAAMAAQTAKVAGIPLAEGGIIMPRPGGTQATIGEAGQAEAVIPLDRASEFGFGGGNVTVNVISYGGLLGNQSEAREFAVAVDRELLKLRQSNESVAFDSGVV